MGPGEEIGTDFVDVAFLGTKTTSLLTDVEEIGTAFVGAADHFCTHRWSCLRNKMGAVNAVEFCRAFFFRFGTRIGIQGKMGRVHIIQGVATIRHF